MQADPTSRRLRAVFVTLLVVGLALRAISASVVLGPNGIHALEPDLQTLALVRWTQVAVNIIGWLMIVFGVRDIAARSRPGGPLIVTVWCWGIVLVLDLVWLAMLAAETDLFALLQWSARLTTVALSAGGVAAIIHARDGDADAKLLRLAGLGLLLYAGVLVAQEFEVFSGVRRIWAPYLIMAVAHIGLLGSMAVLPWTPVGGAELQPTAAGTSPTGKEGSASTDFIVGALFLGGGAALTYFSMTGGGIGGRAVLAWGPMLYGFYRLVRGFTR